MNPFKLFKSKEQEEITKEIPILTSTVHVSKTLKLASMTLSYDTDNRSLFQARLRYSERPGTWPREGLEQEHKIIADSWDELLDKVNHYLQENDNEDPDFH